MCLVLILSLGGCSIIRGAPASPRTHDDCPDTLAPRADLVGFVATGLGALLYTGFMGAYGDRPDARTLVVRFSPSALYLVSAVYGYLDRSQCHRTVESNIAMEMTVQPADRLRMRARDIAAHVDQAAAKDDCPGVQRLMGALKVTDVAVHDAVSVRPPVRRCLEPAAPPEPAASPDASPDASPEPAAPQ